ncbi:hypothetical protein LEP1GSC103_3776 [Leptospira borgpetersenii serovar Javanica str. UI 09931]|uniref:Uncharacterized protein n=2 Tax=Leptospira borgpetersenii TaxID=174 RepID=A0ABN0I2J3_LEPBO|nr:hypothetical protein LEP1GSC128_2007 [Leptospira borgpetersenii str. 200801926]EKQ93334.1 hypothetical protein LEP1GSC101_3909 [Leptospira borgpetersenii str. UI 09149]EKQ98235.1 hypothetical protein LEP1GSC121_3437 [Leptospira borgpetersenii serovar Castellonis str. 200801910]EMN11602.1 hypothetical protein LEP1GSC055_1534 [Leptospira borgpetersenii str. Brem 307]EMO09919.1 hypothetical protein LEP1GSC137_1833 [Leptospira borgpetersenii str. Noumea 25]EPG59184.1 hypothetical protein LEP1GS
MDLVSFPVLIYRKKEEPSNCDSFITKCLMIFSNISRCRPVF